MPEFYLTHSINAMNIINSQVWIIEGRGWIIKVLITEGPHCIMVCWVTIMSAMVASLLIMLDSTKSFCYDCMFV